MKTMQQWFDAYGVSHQNPTNKAVHWICVPLIFFTIIGLLSLIPAGFFQEHLHYSWAHYIHFGTLLLLFGLYFFARLSNSIFIGMLAISVVVLLLVDYINVYLGPSTALGVYAGVFVLAWIGQFIGHKVEGAKPSFFQDLQFLLIGPAWLLHFVYRKLGIPY